METERELASAKPVGWKWPNRWFRRGMSSFDCAVCRLGVGSRSRSADMSALSFLSDLLWDVDPDQLDLERHAGFVIRRVLERGTWTEWQSVRAHFGDDCILQEVQRMPRLAPKSLTFVAAVLGQQPESFPCFASKPSLGAPWSF
jgi:hypothetical protein